MFDFAHHHIWTFSDLGTGPSPQAATDALAWQDTFIRQIPSLNLDKPAHPHGLIHFYQTPYPSLILGPKDSKLPQLQTGIDFLKMSGYAVHLRAHGGLAVVSDPGVLNLAYVSDLQAYPLSIDQAYQEMVTWVRLALSPYGLQVDSYEIAQSYCPGSYDLVVDGKKIGGIAQRRFKSGLATAAYLSISGNQAQRANLVRHFYQLSQAGDTYPNIDPQVMASLTEWLPHMSISQFKQDLLAVMAPQTSITSFTQADLTLYQKMLTKAKERNQSLYPH